MFTILVAPENKARRMKQRSNWATGMNLNTKGLLCCSLVLLLVATVLVGAAGSEASDQRRTAGSKSRTAQRTEEIFRRDCARCHGGDGRGETPLGAMYKAPDFTDREWWKEHPQMTNARSLASIVSQGKAGMPAFGKKLTGPEIKLLVNYVRRFRNQSSTTATQ